MKNVAQLFLFAAVSLALMSCSSDAPGPSAGASDDANTSDTSDVSVEGSDAAEQSDAGPDQGDTVTAGDAPPGHERFILDDEGGVLLLRGINVESAAKGDPERVARIDADDVERMAVDWGFNYVRYLIFWDAIEPEPGEIDEGYFDKVEDRLDLFHDAGMWVMLDMHQDVYAARFCCDGAPEWAIRDDGEPFELQSQWFTNYYQPAVIAAFDNFFEIGGDHGDLQDHYEAMWVAVVERFADHPAVIGYDLMNEPFPGSDFDAIEALSRRSPAGGGTSRTFDEDKLHPFYQRLIDAIRQVDQDGWIAYESRYGAPGNGSPCYLPPLVDPRLGGPRLVYAPHLYSVTLEATSRYAANDETIPAWEEERLSDSERLGNPIVLGEWGLAWSFEDSQRFYEDVLEMADRNLFGWAYWSWDPNGPDGWGPWDRSTGEDNPNAAVLVRPYPRRVAGVPTRLEYDVESGAFALDFNRADGVGGVTEVFLPVAVYGDDWEVTMDTDSDGAWSVDWDAGRRVLSVTADPAVASHSLRIQP